MQKKKREKAEDFIGWKSDDGMLEVIDIHGKQGRITTFKVVCHNCKEDKELFPDGYFICQKSHLIKGKKPCGCSKRPNWNKYQYLVIARRAVKDSFIVHGFAEEFHGATTKLSIECIKDGYKWVTSTRNVINTGSGCQKCIQDTQRSGEQQRFEKCKAICETEGYEAIGFVDGYTNRLSRFEYKCLAHGIQNVSYNSFVSKDTRCGYCWKERQKEISGMNGYYPERKDEQDFLYVLNFDDKFIKVGRSFDIERRVGKNQLQKESGISNIIKLRIFTGTHQEIYNLEQELHTELRERNFQYYVKWSTECFTSDSLPYLNMLLNKCGLEEVKL